MIKENELRVFISSRDSTSDECGENLGHHAWITLNREKGALCLSCADLDHLVFLPSGDAALTRRARAGSKLSAVVLKWSQARKRYERQGLLVEEAALESAEKACLADSEARARSRERQAALRKELDLQYVERFASRLRELFPRIPPGREVSIAEHACRKYSGRVGRTAAAKGLDEDAISLAVMAHVRHTETEYDDFLARGYERREARELIREAANRVLNQWKRPA